jgi:DNA mismatch repair ATPase MutS
MTFHSILFKTQQQLQENAPNFFVDLNLDQIVDEVTAEKEEYDLKPFFYTPLHDIDDLIYRHEVMQDIETLLLKQLKYFAQNMRKMRELLTQSPKLYYEYQKKRTFLDAVELYCDALNSLANHMSLVCFKSEGFLSFQSHLADFLKTDDFTNLLTETKKIQADFSLVKYNLFIKGNSISVGPYQSESDYSVEVENVFSQFKQEIIKDNELQLPTRTLMNHIEAQILDGIVKLYPQLFATLDAFCEKNKNYLNETLMRFDREIQFYLAYLEYLIPLKRMGLSFCYPKITHEKQVEVKDGFDLALAKMLSKEKGIVVCNEFYLKDKERIIVVSGPNQGGKTTFARTFGQLHYLASIGCPVPGSTAELFLCDCLFAHFEKEETIHTLRGKLQDDLLRIHEILEQATSKSILLVNEIFSSTTLQDSIFLSKKIMDVIIQRDLMCVWVTFIDELATYSEKNVSMVSTVAPDNPALRTFKIVRQPADGFAYALSIAEKYHLTFDCIRKRIES